MFTVVPLFLLFGSLQFGAAEAEPNPPHSLDMITLNTNYTLTWDWDQSSVGSDPVTFTVQYTGNHQLKKKTPRWNTACRETTGRSCDLTGFNLHYLGLYMLRVQANVNGSHSVWEYKQFCPDKEAAIGPPSKVRLSAAVAALDIVITDPQTSSNSSMRDLLKLSFQICYWEQSEDGKVLNHETFITESNMPTLSNLTPWTQYCVRVQSRYEYYNKTSSFTPPQCIQTEGVVPWWKIFLYFLSSLLLCFLVVLVFIYGGHQCFQFCKATLFPGEKLPSPLKHHEIDYPCLLVSDSELDLCDPVIICVESAILENNVDPAADSTGPPVGLGQDSSGRHSRQNSSSSGDSGVYSAGGNSGALQHNIASTFPDVKRHFDSEQLKMLSMKSDFKVCPVIPDEGVVDMEV
ncbi:hypothetical protein AMECASPLE_010139 [Ameca splendens]|uniref:Fibronectin type-III domain-containing protein n=1 Tax=Ameca splendens TaxID=208324 RepID=A0ABV0ZXA1_9TELE